MKKFFITTSASQTRKLGGILAKELRGGELIALTGELGSGKTTFAQGVLAELGAKGPYTSPTFVVMKKYKSGNSKCVQSSAFPLRQTSCRNSSKPSFIYHIDAYRVGAKDILDLGWGEIISDKKNVVIVEWAERIRRIIPQKAMWLIFEHSGEDKRKIIAETKNQKPKTKNTDCKTIKPSVVF